MMSSSLASVRCQSSDVELMCPCQSAALRIDQSRSITFLMSINDEKGAERHARHALVSGWEEKRVEEVELARLCGMNVWDIDLIDIFIMG